MVSDAFCIAPAIDLISGHVVRLQQGAYDKKTVYDDSPLEWAKRFEAAGVNRLHIVDLDGAKSGQTDNAKAIESIRSGTSLAIQLGGGIRNQASLAYYDNIGVDYFIIGSLLLKSFDEAVNLIQAYPNRVIAGLDHRDQYLKQSGWTESSDMTVSMMLAKLDQYELSSTIITDIQTDGMLAGPNNHDLGLYLPVTRHPIIISGGVRNADDVRACYEAGAGGCIIGRSVLSGAFSISDLSNLIHTI